MQPFVNSLKKKLAEILESPRIEANKLHGMPDCYKIKLRSSGYRLVYQVLDKKVVVLAPTLHHLLTRAENMAGPILQQTRHQLIAAVVVGLSKLPLGGGQRAGPQ